MFLKLHINTGINEVCHKIDKNSLMRHTEIIRNCIVVYVQINCPTHHCHQCNSNNILSWGIANNPPQLGTRISYT